MSEESTETEARTQSRARSLAGLWIALIVVALAGGGWYLAGEGERSARGQCYEAVKAKIGFPGQASFDLTFSTHEGDIYKFGGHVSSDRTYNFECTVGPQAKVDVSVI